MSLRLRTNAMGFRTNGPSDQCQWQRTIDMAPLSLCAHFTPCLHGVYIVHTLPAHFTAVKMSSAFPRPTISAANGCAIIAAFPLKRLHHRMRPVDADLVYTSTGQVALTILLENGGLMLIAELTRLILQWLW